MSPPPDPIPSVTSSRTSDGPGSAGTSQFSAGRRPRLEQVLLERGIATLDVLTAARERMRAENRSLPQVLLDEKVVEEDALAAILADVTGLAVTAREAIEPDPVASSLLPAEIAQRLGVVPVRIESDALLVATADPMHLPALDEVAARTGMRTRLLLVAPATIRELTQHATSAGRSPYEEFLAQAQPADGELSVEAAGVRSAAACQLDTEAEDAPTVRLVNSVLADAIRRRVSDIHIEAEKEQVRIRFRIDGVLREVLTLPAAKHASILSRIKILAGLDITEARRPQDGRIKATHAGKEYDLRVSTLPSYFGEKAVLRVLDPSASTFDLDRSGIDPAVLLRWREIINRPHGLVLMTGPTGSGKTSTLFASLLELRDPTLNLVTVEDPVEYQFEGIVHVPVRHDIGMTFAAALRSILRQDPDVVLVGEIRDRETAGVAVQAAMTGHLVLSTLHTNDAVGAIPRLLDLGVEPPLLAGSLLGVMAQRLARTVCSDCAQPHRYDASLLAPLGWRGERADAGTRRGIGCKRCLETGMRGRTALAELVFMTPALAKLVTSGADYQLLRAQARKDGTVLLVEAGLAKVLAGDCPPEEVLAVAAPEEGSGSPEVPAPAPSAPAVRCGSCGGELDDRWRYCAACGAGVPPVSARPCVLICDDDPSTRRVVAAVLGRDFPRVLESADGKDALARIRTEAPDLLVLDHEMPGLKGIDLLRAVRELPEHAALPILMLTGSVDTNIEEELLGAGADDFLAKPFRVERLRARAKALLAARRRMGSKQGAGQSEERM